MTSSLNWRTKTKKTNGFQSKMNFMDLSSSPKKNIFGKSKNTLFGRNKNNNLFGNNKHNNYNNYNDDNYKKKDIQIQELGGHIIKQEAPKKSFNKKIILQTKEKGGNYKDKFSCLESNVTIKKFNKNTKISDKPIYNDSWGIVYSDEEYAERQLKLKEQYSRIDDSIRKNCEKILIEHDQNRYNFLNYNKMTQKEFNNLEKLHKLFKLQQYLLMDFSSIDIAYDYMNELNMTVDQFIYAYSLDKIICMETKDFIKYDRNVRKKYNDIVKLLKIQKENRKLNKQQLAKLEKKNEYFFKKLQLNFYKKHF